MEDSSYLRALNAEQLKAVQHPHDIPLQILAGPGSGKTKVLTSRIAYLILHEHVQPASICAVTFTNKAAREMKERLTKFIGKAKVDEVKMGTFHALCAFFLRRYPTRVGVKSNFTVCDADESHSILKRLLRSYRDYLEENNLSLEVRNVMSVISKAKSKGEGPRDLANRIKPSHTQWASTAAHDIDRIIAELYDGYEKFLRDNNSLDFDDLLVYGVKLFSQHQHVTRWCQHVLVDEFQDTNTLQYELMRHIAFSSKCITIVGDPDQSIYGWRSAEVANLARMKLDFPATAQIYLEQNYRSTASILRACMAIVAQDPTRIPKTLHTSHPEGYIPVLQYFPSEQDEAACIAREIKRLSACSGGMLGWEDFVILLRMNSLSRSLESALRKEGIPCRVLKGHKFFERLEIKDLLAYLQLVDNPDFLPALERVINTPARGIGDKTLGEILRAAQSRQMSPLAFIERIYDSRIPDIKPPIKRKVASFVKTIRELRGAAEKGAMPADIIRKLIILTEYEDHLKRTQPDSDTRWENVMELISFASEIQMELNYDSLQGLPEIDKDWDDMPNEVDAAELDEEGFVEVKPTDLKSPNAGSDVSTPLRLFLQASLLSGESSDGGEAGEKEKVTISTCHSAKGLEWPVVFVPAVEEGTFPFALSEDTDEERRLLYVACTRAQNLLYLSHCKKRLVAGKQIDRKLSAFVATVIQQAPDTFVEETPEITSAGLHQMAAILSQEAPSEAVVQQKLIEYYRTDRYHQFMNTAERTLSTTFVAAERVYRDDAGKSNQKRIATNTPSTSHTAVPTRPLKSQPVSFTTTAVPRHDGAIHSSGFSAARLESTLDPPYRQGSCSSNVNSCQGSYSDTPVSLPESRSGGKLEPGFPPSVLRERTNPGTRRNSRPEIPKQGTREPPGSSCSSSDSPTQETRLSSPGVVTHALITERPVKRRLGMGRIATGYSNKKFKPPQS